MNEYKGSRGGGPGLGNRPGQPGRGGDDRPRTIGSKGRKPVSAGYNFVPLSNRVLLPEWAPQVSHDVPFSDGLSGEIDCELITESPAYVRNGIDEEPKTAKDAPAYLEFFQVDGKYIIPGSGIKGMLRNVVEIASFGKMPLRVDDHKYAVRDLQNPELYTYKMTKPLGNRTYEPKTKAAWLERDPGSRDWFLVPCEFARIEHQDLAKVFGGRLDFKSKQPAQEKYTKWGAKSREIAFDVLPQDRHPHSRGNTFVYRKVDVSTVGRGSKKGTLVFTGQPGGNKHLEFVFHGERPADRKKVQPELRRVFDFIHSDPGSGKANEEWGFWKQRFERSERVPVFYLGDIVAPTSMGLALMYRLAYKNSVHDAIRDFDREQRGHFRSEPDLSDLLFGYLPEKEGDVGLGLKGRVHVSHGETENAKPEEQVSVTVLGGPKPTFYPNYIEQTENASAYKTFMDSDGHIRGWKRYPVRSTDAQLPPPPAKSSEESRTRLRPLKAGARFRFKVRFHNLRPAELGVLWWALTWGENPKLRHAIGMGKAYGLGKARIEVTGRAIETVAGEPYDGTGLEAFVMLMNTGIGNDWNVSAQITQLRAMADPDFVPRTADGETDAASAQRAKLGQMQLVLRDVNEIKDANEFKDAKQDMAYLLPHAPWDGPKPAPWKLRTPVAAAGAEAGETSAATLTLQDRFDEVRKSNSLQKLIDLLVSLKTGEAAWLETCDFKRIETIVNIGVVESFEAAQINPAIRRIAAGKMAALIKPAAKWDDVKKARFERLKAAAV